MLKKFRYLAGIAFALSLIFLVGNTNNVYAGESDTMDTKVVASGYTVDGGRYIAYETTIYDETKASPRIVVSKKISMYVTYSGHITPPSTFKYNEYDSDYNTQMKGTLNRISYTHDADYLLRPETRALYEGTVFGNI